MIRRLQCFFMGHRWHFANDAATSGTDQTCSRCGAGSTSKPDPSYKGLERPRPGETPYNYPF